MKNLYLLLLFLPVIGCLNSHDEDVFDFGSSYGLTQTSELPSISNDSLITRVAYSGCNGDHQFELRNQIPEPSVAELWLFKQTPDQQCDAYFEEARKFPLSNNIIQSTKIILVGPGDTRITLKK